MRKILFAKRVISGSLPAVPPSMYESLRDWTRAVNAIKNSRAAKPKPKAIRMAKLPVESVKRFGLQFPYAYRFRLNGSTTSVLFVQIEY